jgi:hypothetical protein
MATTNKTPSLPPSKRTIKLQRVIIAQTVLQFLVISALLFIFIFIVVANEERSVWLSRQEEGATLAITQINAYLDGVEEHIVDSIEFTEASNHFTGENAELFLELLEEDLGGGLEISELVIVDEAGKTIANIMPPDETSYISLNDLANPPPYYTKAQAEKTQIIISDLFRTPKDTAYLVAAAAFEDSDVVALRLNLSVLDETINSLTLSRTWQSYLVDTSGNIIAHTTPTLRDAKTNLAGSANLALLQGLASNK